MNLGSGRTATAVTAGDFHTCALLDDGSVRCWGFGADGRLGYGNTASIGDNEAPGTVGPVALGGRATAISAGGSHTCAVLVGGSVRCWGFGLDGRLGYPTADPLTVPRQTVGDDENPDSAGPVDLGGPATAISAGREHTCALLENRSVRCWGDPGGFSGGDGGFGRLGYPNGDQFEEFIGDDETPASAGPVDIGGTAAAISAADFHTCAILDGGSVRCWGLQNPGGRLGYPNRLDRAVGDHETPGSVGPVDLGVGRTAKAISAGNHTCAILDNGTVRCWGPGAAGRLGYGNTNNIGDNETPGSVGPVNLGAAAAAISAGSAHTCARLASTAVRCWGEGADGRLGYGNTNDIGDNETPAAAGPVNFGRTAAIPPPRPRAPGSANPLDPDAPALRAQAARLQGLRRCLAKRRSHARREIRRARRLTGSRRSRARRHAKRHARRLRSACLKRWGRTPGRVTGLKARPVSRDEVVLTFRAAGTHGSRPPAARSYVVKQSRRPIRSARSFRRAQTLCNGTCSFPTIKRVGGTISLRVTDLRPRTLYFYSVAARDNVSRRLGARSGSARVRTR